MERLFTSKDEQAAIGLQLVERVLTTANIAPRMRRAALVFANTASGRERNKHPTVEGEMIGKSVTQWNQRRIDPDINALLDEIRMQVANEIEPRHTLELSLKCFAETRKLAMTVLYNPHQPLKADVKYPLIDALLELAVMVDPAKPVRKQIIDQAFDWLRFAEQHDYAALKARRLIYYWLRREDKSVVGFDPGQYSADFDARNVFTDAELDEFYRDNEQLVRRAMTHEVYPEQGVFYVHPFSDQSARTYFEYYEKLLQVAHGERVLEQPEPLLA